MDAPGAAVDTFQQRWEAALDELELDVDEAEAMLNSDHVPAPVRDWGPPQGLGTLPEPLLERAQLLVERHFEVAQRLTDALVLSRRQAVLNEKLKAGGPRRPVYIDAAG